MNHKIYGSIDSILIFDICLCICFMLKLCLCYISSYLNALRMDYSGIENKIEKFKLKNVDQFTHHIWF